MKFKGIEDRKKRVFNICWIVFENDVIYILVIIVVWVIFVLIGWGCM